MERAELKIDGGTKNGFAVLMLASVPLLAKPLTKEELAPDAND